MRRSLSDWLRWQESLNPREIDLGLERVRQVARRLPIAPPAGAVFTVAGTNGKGTTIACLDRLLTSGGYRTAVYTSPHLVRYNERICIGGSPVADAMLIDAFERIEAVREDTPLTYFEYGTLAAMLIFSMANRDAWILEVGLGGRLDAVNLIDPDFSLITTIALDHQQWLGDTVEQIAAEKAGIMRAGAPAFYGDEEPPAAIVARAGELGAPLYCYGRDYAVERDGGRWAWRGAGVMLERVRCPTVADAAQLRNFALALAAIERFDAMTLTEESAASLTDDVIPAGRFQVVAGEPQWILDVAHNEQAAAVLRDRISEFAGPRQTTAVIAMLADKPLEAFVGTLAGLVDRWIVAAIAGPRSADCVGMAKRVARLTGCPAEPAESPPAAFERAIRLTPPEGRILCCGSFHIVGPAIEWLGLY